ncbi:anti-sigma factor [bacterium]|nr:anti-sigma factor [bacterium]PJA75269.1 MAG: anti-sigma factor [bacterium CG_4_9_14_3_um_filter_65_15]
MLKCKEVSHIVSEDLPLGLWGRMMLKMHLLMCVHCRRYAAQIRSLGRGARRELDHRPSADQARRMEDRIVSGVKPDERGDS